MDVARQRAQQHLENGVIIRAVTCRYIHVAKKHAIITPHSDATIVREKSHDEAMSAIHQISEDAPQDFFIRGLDELGLTPKYNIGCLEGSFKPVHIITT
jgi:hypothetical protein